MQHQNRNNVVPLDELDDFEVADNSPDVRGWDVVTREGRRVGEVEELLVDPSAMKVRYLDIELDDEVRRSDRDRRVLIPVGQARLDEQDDRVLVDNLSADQFRTLPTYDGRLDRQYEDSLRSHFGTAGSAGATGAAGSSRDRDYYSDDHFDDSRFYGARRGTGQGLRSRGRDSVDHDRHERGGPPGRMALSEEELAVRRSQVNDTERVAADLRKERADIDAPGDVRRTEEDRGRSR